MKSGLHTIDSISDGAHLSRLEYDDLRRRYLEEVGPSQTDGMFAFAMWVSPLVEYLNRRLDEKGATVEPPPKSSAYPANDYKAWG